MDTCRKTHKTRARRFLMAGHWVWRWTNTIHINANNNCSLVFFVMGQQKTTNKNKDRPDRNVSWTHNTMFLLAKSCAEFTDFLLCEYIVMAVLLCSVLSGSIYNAHKRDGTKWAVESININALLCVCAVKPGQMRGNSDFSVTISQF